MTITDFEELEEAVIQQQLSVGASEEEIVFPDTLNVTASPAEDTLTYDGAAKEASVFGTISGVTGIFYSFLTKCLILHGYRLFKCCFKCSEQCSQKTPNGRTRKSMNWRMHSPELSAGCDETDRMWEIIVRYFV